MAKITAEYIWIDGQRPTAKLRSKTKILDAPVKKVDDIPEWGFDGSSTSQASGHFSDLLLRPVKVFPDPLHRENDILVLCEVLNPDGSVHWSNTRAQLREIAEKYKAHEAWFGIEQEYTMFDGNRPLGWPDHGFPAPQGGYYCGVGSDEVFGRELVEAHADACQRAGISNYGTNAEVMPGQWEFQIGALGPIEVADELWIARWLLYRIGEDLGISATLYPKPVKGDWNGAGAHTNFSTNAMREGYDPIIAACEALSKKAEEHVSGYGADIEHRLTGSHETAPWHEFSYGVSDRGASVRIPWQVEVDKKGYIEDRRPNANCDPYDVTYIIIDTVCSALA